MGPDPIKTQLNFVQMPRWPMPLPAFSSPPVKVDLREILSVAHHVTIAEPEMFAGIEQPRYFYDINHINGEGRSQFTHIFGDFLQRALAASRSVIQ